MKKPFISYDKNLLNTGLSDSAHVNYEVMLDRYKLSIQNNWQDDNGIFIYYSIGDMQKSRGYSKPKAIKILKELEQKGLIIKVHQKGKPTKIYLVENEYTQFALEMIENSKKNKKHKKFAPKKVDKKDKQQEVTEINTFGVEVVEEVTEVSTNPELPVIDYTEKQSVFDVFKAVIGREPDRSFQKYITRRSMEMNITGENMRGIIEIAKKARNPEAYIISVIKSAQPQQQTYQQEQQAPEPAKDAPLEEWEIEWLIESQYGNQARIDELKKMLKVIRQKKAEEEAKRPLEDWEIDWLNEQKRYEQSCESEDSEIIHQEVPSYLLE